MKTLIVLLIVLISPLAFGAGGGEGVPWKVIFQQTFNFILAIGVLVYFFKSKVVAHFKEREQNFTDLLLRAQTTRDEAEQTKQSIQDRLAKLESTAQSSLNKAKAESEELRQRMINEAKYLSKKLEEDARRTAQFEIDRARTHLREDLLEAAVLAAQEDLKSSISDPDQKRLKDEFVEKIRVVN